MIEQLEIEGVDLSNPDVIKILDVLGRRFEQVNLENAELRKDNSELRKDNSELSDEISELKAKLEEVSENLEKITGRKSSGARRTRRYSTREIKDYPRPEAPSKKSVYAVEQEDHETVYEEVDHRFCTQCGNPLAKSHTHYNRDNGEDIINGRWCNVKQRIFGRYCRFCGRTMHAKPPNFLPNEQLSITILGMVSTMRHLRGTYGSIAKLFSMIYERNLPTSRIIDADALVSERLEPVYWDLLSELRDSPVLGGDEVLWFENGNKVWTFTVQDRHTTLFHSAATRSKLVSEALLPDFCGIVVGDSHPAWGAIGTLLQKCLVHYFRDLHRTRDRNKAEEFAAFFKELRSVLKSAIALRERHARAKDIPRSSIARLQNRINGLARAEYEDRDCKRYAKRLRRERDALLTFLKYDGVPYHNNASEQAVRIFAIMRKIFYGSRSERGLKTTEIRETIFATCEKRGINPYKFIMDYLRGDITRMPKAQKAETAVACAA